MKSISVPKSYLSVWCFLQYKYREQQKVGYTNLFFYKYFHYFNDQNTSFYLK